MEKGAEGGRRWDASLDAAQIEPHCVLCWLLILASREMAIKLFFEELFSVCLHLIICKNLVSLTVLGRPSAYDRASALSVLHSCLLFCFLVFLVGVKEAIIGKGSAESHKVRESSSQTRKQAHSLPAFQNPTAFFQKLCSSFMLIPRSKVVLHASNQRGKLRNSQPHSQLQRGMSLGLSRVTSLTSW